MAEGHAVVRWARALRPLVHEPLVAVDAPRRWQERARGLVGACIEDIETRGKHLLIHVSTGATIHCHAMQYGSWQVGVPGMPLRKAERYVRLRLRTPTHEAVFFHGPVMEILTADELAAHAALGALGPDLMSDGFDRGEAWRRVQADGARAVGDVVLDQRVVAGIGNIYKSEGLFLAHIDPRRAVDTVERVELERLWDVLIPLMHEGARHPGAITTLPSALRTDGRRTWVYRRRGHPCFRCGAPVEMVRQGELRRATYYCPECQRSGGR
jgi:formamidopyrimidine-DNA glycosylase